MKKLVALISLMVLGFVVTACGGSSATPTSAPTDAPTTTESADSAESAVDIASLLPSEPAKPDEFRFDSAQVVAQTGRPQLIEKWAED